MGIKHLRRYWIPLFVATALLLGLAMRTSLAAPGSSAGQAALTTEKATLAAAQPAPAVDRAPSSPADRQVGTAAGDGRVLAAAQGRSVFFTYDANGRLTGASYIGGRQISYSYDQAGNLTGRQISQAPAVTPTPTPTLPPGSTATPTPPPGSTATPTPPGGTATPVPSGTPNWPVFIPRTLKGVSDPAGW